MQNYVKLRQHGFFCATTGGKKWTATCHCCVPSVTPEVSRISTTCGDPVAILAAPGWGVAAIYWRRPFQISIAFETRGFFLVLFDIPCLKHSKTIFSPHTLQVTLPLHHYVQQIHPSRIWSKVAVKRARLTLVWQGFQRRREIWDLHGCSHGDFQGINRNHETIKHVIRHSLHHYFLVRGMIICF